MKLGFLIISVFYSFDSISQSTNWTYSSVDEDVYATIIEKKIEQNDFFWGSSFDYAVYQFSNILRDNLNNKKELQRIEFEKQQASAKISIVKSQFTEQTKYPTNILDGWHSVIATDNLNFCKDLKVLVEANRIKKLVIENYLALKFSATEIRSAKAVATLTNYNGEQLSIVELYFLYDLDGPAIVPEPLKPGYLCFWSDMKHFGEIELWLNDVEFADRLGVLYNSEPDCFENGMVCRILKPGSYTFEGYGRGSIDWMETIVIKEGMCLKYRLGKKKRQ